MWATEYTPDDIVCKACNQQLPTKTKLQGTRGKACLLTKKGFQEVTIYVKKCKHCQIRYCFRDWRADKTNNKLRTGIKCFQIGVLNFSNKLLVPLVLYNYDILLEMREHVKREPPGNCNAVILAKPDLETRYLTEKLYDGYFASEALTDTQVY